MTAPGPWGQRQAASDSEIVGALIVAAYRIAFEIARLYVIFHFVVKFW